MHRRILCGLCCLLVLQAACGSRRDVGSLPHSQKGWELYSWRSAAGSGWLFSLLPGTNAIKSWEAVTAPSTTMQGAKELEHALARLPRGERVFWPGPAAATRSSSPRCEFPPESILSDIIDFAAQHGVRLTVTR